MRYYLLPEKGNDYKANLHCHTTVSDGAQTPEAVKNAFLERGYSIVAYTDHNILIGHNDLTDDRFLALNGFEIDVTEDIPAPFDQRKCFHICLIAKVQDNLVQPCWHRSAYLFGHASEYLDRVQFDESKPDFIREYTPECFKKICDEGHENGFYITYNHPAWSLESYPEYSLYEGMDAMEMYNGGAILGGHLDFNPRVYDDLLRQGKRLYVSGGDDNHDSDPHDPFWDIAEAWTVIRAKDLGYRTVTKALEDGHLYASSGPEIHELYIEDGRVHITTSEAWRITMNTAYRYAYLAMKRSGEPITKASFPYSPLFKYFRITVTDAKGRTAVTNAYFCDDLPEMK